MDRAYHDTYYVVAHGSYVGSVLVIAALVFLAWWIIGRLARRPMPRLRVIVLGAFVAGLLMSLASVSAFLFLDVFVQHLWIFGVVNTLSAAGGLVAGLATIVTAIVLIWTLLRWAIDRFQGR